MEGTIGATESKKPIIAQLDIIDEKNDFLEKAVNELTDRLSAALATPTPTTAGEDKKAPADCGITERLCQITDGLNNHISAIQGLTDRLQL